ncbi:MAG: hypothetical protein WEF50_23380 [Myxococcota bacterium]
MVDVPSTRNGPQVELLPSLFKLEKGNADRVKDRAGNMLSRMRDGDLREPRSVNQREDPNSHRDFIELAPELYLDRVTVDLSALQDLKKWIRMFRHAKPGVASQLCGNPILASDLSEHRLNVGSVPRDGLCGIFMKDPFPGGLVGRDNPWQSERHLEGRCGECGGLKVKAEGRQMLDRFKIVRDSREKGRAHDCPIRHLTMDAADGLSHQMPGGGGVLQVCL